MKRIAITIIGAVVLAAASPVFAMDGHSPPLIIPAAAFHNDGEDPNGFYFHPHGYLNGDGSVVNMYAAVYLPAYAQPVSLTLHAVDGSVSCAEPDIGAWFYRTPIVDTPTSIMGNVFTSGSSSSMQSPSVSLASNPPVDNLGYRYYVRVRICSGLHDFYSLEIDYTE